ncbi:MAG: hypothetical protein ACO1OB_00385 [Archangium sp.]
MASPWEEVRRESLEMPAVGQPQRPSPLPWMLLAVTIAMMVGVLVLGRSRLEDERLRTAAALKANDDVKAKLKVALTDIETAKSECTEADANSGALNKKLVTLELQNRRLQEELTRAKKGKK